MSKKPLLFSKDSDMVHVPPNPPSPIEEILADLLEHATVDTYKVEQTKSALLEYMANKQTEEIEALQVDIVESDKYSSDVDQQAWAYARVHRLAGDRIKALEARFGIER